MAEALFPELGELVLCKVKEILKTTIFIEIEKYGKTGVISTSEIAPGRIRNIRDYVVINKKIICKVLRVDKTTGHIDLSLRRVSQKESREEMQKYKKEEIAEKILELVLKNEAKKTAEKIKATYPSIHEFLELSINNPDILEKFISRENAKKLLEIIKDKIKSKIITVKAVLAISSNAPNGLTLIKNALLSQKNVSISYIGAPNYLITAEDENHKIANKKLDDAIASLTELMKESNGKVEVKEKE